MDVRFSFLVLCLASCGGVSDDVPPTIDPDPWDLVSIEDTEFAGKADGHAFNPNEIVDDFLFEDALYLDAAAIQSFLAVTPYGSSSFLADHRNGGRLTSTALAEVARLHRINPLVLLVRLQVEMGLISATTHPGTRRVDFAMGCGCPDNRPCQERYRGIDKQLDCAAERLRTYLDDLDKSGTTPGGWEVATAKKTSDRVQVTPRNRATAALYTYTPWVLRGRGGNWLFWNIFQKYSRSLLQSRPNHRWIGDGCDSLVDCGYGDAQCIDGFPGGMCSLTCDRLCPDSHAPYVAVTFCVDLDPLVGDGLGGRCVSRCDRNLFPGNDGCREGFRCVPAQRAGGGDVEKNVCLPISNP